MRDLLSILSCATVFLRGPGRAARSRGARLPACTRKFSHLARCGTLTQLEKDLRQRPQAAALSITLPSQTQCLVFPCSIRKTISGSCTRGKESNLIEIHPFALYLNATENRDVGGTRVNRLSAGARSGVLPAPLFLLQQYKRACKLSAGSPQALLHLRDGSLH